MATEIDDNEPVPKLTTKLRSEIMPPEPFEYTVLKPAEPIVETENKEETDEEETFEETMESVDIPKVQERKPQREKTRNSKIMTSPSEPKSISRLHVELRKNSDARKKTDSAILDIRKELKDLLLIHHATIKDLQKQMTQMRRKIVTIENSRKSTKLKISGKKTSSNKKSKKKTNLKKNKKR
jgi:ribosomal protein S13